MPKRTGIGTLIAVLVLLLLFVGYRARTFHYCASTGDRPQARIVSGSCAQDEEPLEWGRLGWPGRIKLAAATTAKAFGGN